MGVKTKEQIETPALIIDMDKLEANIKKMSDYLADKTAKLRPHFKTHKSPAIAFMQLAAGAKGLTCAKLGEAEVLAAAGIHDILIANQVVDTNKIYRMAALARQAKITVCVDNADNVKELSEAAQACGTTLYVLIEVDVGMKRCGIDTKEEALLLAKQIDSAKGLVFEGIQAYAGQISHEKDLDTRVSAAEAAISKVSAIKDHLEENGLKVNEISGASTGTYHITGNNTVFTEIQAGSYVFMDSDYSQMGLGFENALTVLATVIHKRKGIAITDAGQKVCCRAMGLPEVKDYDISCNHISEEHCRLVDEKDELKYLQKVELISSHCCTTVNLHDNYYGVRGDIWEATWPVAGRGKSW
jgi:D-serine deaminase-like pyridoxal phosphate-dependent protein